MPAGASLNIINTGSRSLKLCTLYAPPEPHDGLVRASKVDAADREEHFDGKTTESPAAGQVDKSSEL